MGSILTGMQAGEIPEKQKAVIYIPHTKKRTTEKRLDVLYHSDTLLPFCFFFVVTTHTIKNNNGHWTLVCIEKKKNENSDVSTTKCH